MSPVDRIPLLRARDLHRVYHLPRESLRGERGERHTLAGVDLDLFEHGSLGIVGESGSGKTTLVRALLGIDRGVTGSVTYQGREIKPGRPSRLRWYRRQAQVVFQDPLSSLDPRMTVESIIREPLVCLRVEEDHERRIDEVLDDVGLSAAMRRRYPHEFSGGQQQRIAIAHAIAPRPRLLIGDELVSALDVSVRIQILDLLRALASDLQLTLVVVSHDLGVVRYLCDDVIVMRNGEIVERGNTEHVLAEPAHAYTQELLRAVPRLDPSLFTEASG